MYCIGCERKAAKGGPQARNLRMTEIFFIKWGKVRAPGRTLDRYLGLCHSCLTELKDRKDAQGSCK
jgi:hypothetical protein